jgi:hypothetical protein
MRQNIVENQGFIIVLNNDEYHHLLAMFQELAEKPEAPGWHKDMYAELQRGCDQEFLAEILE